MSWTQKLVVTSPLLLLQTLLLVFRINENILWSYSLVLIPLWTLFTIWLAYVAWNTVALSRRSHTRASQWFGLLLSFLSVSGYILFTIFIVIKLDGVHDWPWGAVWSPFWAVAFLDAIFMMTDTQRVGGYKNKIIYTITWICTTVTSIVLVVQLSRGNPWHFSVVFVGLWIMFGVWLIALSVGLYKRASMSIPQSADRAPPTWMDLLIMFATWAGLAAFTIILTVHLERGGIGIFFIFSPLIIALVIIFSVPVSIYVSIQQRNADKQNFYWYHYLPPVYHENAASIARDLRSGTPLWSDEDIRKYTTLEEEDV
jgi:hypothetical protein